MQLAEALIKALQSRIVTVEYRGGIYRARRPGHATVSFGRTEERAIERALGYASSGHKRPANDRRPNVWGGRAELENLNRERRGRRDET